MIFFIVLLITGQNERSVVQRRKQSGKPESVNLSNPEVTSGRVFPAKRLLTANLKAELGT